MWGGLLITGIGAFLTWESSGYPFGTLRSAKAGFFPLVFSVILLCLGLLMILESMLHARMTAGAQSMAETPFALRSLLAISAAILVFYLLITRYGLVPSTVALVVVAAFAERDVKPLRVALTAVVLSVLAVVIFIYLFAIPLEPFRWG